MVTSMSASQPRPLQQDIPNGVHRQHHAGCGNELQLRKLSHKVTQYLRPSYRQSRNFGRCSLTILDYCYCLLGTLPQPKLGCATGCPQLSKLKDTLLFTHLQAKVHLIVYALGSKLIRKASRQQELLLPITKRKQSKTECKKTMLKVGPWRVFTQHTHFWGNGHQ